MNVSGYKPYAIAGALAAASFLLWRCRSKPAAVKDEASPAPAPAAPKRATPPSTTYEPAKLHGFCKAVFMHYGISDADAQQAADVLQAADLRGIDSHGVARLYAYFGLLQAGRINPTPNIRIVRESPSTATVDGDNGLGLVVGPRANAIAIKKAEEVGSGWVAVCNTNHYGIAGYYSMEATKKGMIGLSMTNTTKLVAPHHGTARMLGTNPIAISAPAGRNDPFVADLATSSVAYGKVEIAQRLEKDMPEGWCIDKHGKPTTSPAGMKDGGALLCLGSDDNRSGHKGYCLSSWVDIMCAVLSGANWGPHAPSFTLSSDVNTTTRKKVGKGIGHFFGAWRVDAFRDLSEFKGQMDDWMDEFRATPSQPGTKVMIPGDPEMAHYRKRCKEGVPVTQAVVNDLKEISRTLNIPF